MKRVEEKLDSFTNDIMSDVIAKRDEMFRQQEADFDLIYKDKELELINKSYEIIEDGLKKIDKEKNEILSRTIMENRVKLLNKRREIIEQIFLKAVEKIVEFTKSDEYYDYLVKEIKEGLELIGEGEKTIFINYKDRDFQDRLNQLFGIEVELEAKNLDIIGGYKIHNKDTNSFLDNSFKKLLKNERESFLEKCKLEIE